MVSFHSFRFFTFRQRIIFFIICVFACYSMFLMMVTSSTSFKQEVPEQPMKPAQPVILESVYLKGKLGNYEPTESEPLTGPGDNGKPVTDNYNVPSSPFGYKDGISKMISLNRSVADTRNEECLYWSYPTSLPTASVVLVFYYESLSVVFRTVNSIINRSPPQFLKEIILVDDGTQDDELAKEFDKKCKEYGDLVKILRNKENEGLISARTTGAKAAVGNVVIFLDAHCEVNVNWLPPLLSVIKKNRRAIAVPLIDGISWDTFEYRPIYGVNSRPIGIFEWGFFYKEMDVVPREGSVFTEPYRSPTHAGGLLAIDRLFFQELGYYDDGLLIWGGEQYELSFKTWMCHGEVLWVPCSRIGHIYRGPNRVTKPNKYSSDVPLSDLNHKRVVDTWFDEEHKKYFYRRHPELDGFTLDVSRPLAVKKQLNCKPFSWFMQNVAGDMLKKYPYPHENVQWGNIRSSKSGLCLSSGNSDLHGKVKVYVCPTTPVVNMLFRLDERGHIGVSERGIYYKDGGLIRDVYEYFGKGPWSYDKSTQQLKYNLDNTVMCLTHLNDVGLAECNDDQSQKWLFEHIKYSDTNIYKN